MIVKPVGYTTQIDCFGDSLTAGAGNGDGRTITTVLAAMYPDRVVNNFGIGGQTSAQIAARQGGRPSTLTVSGGQLSASFASTTVTPSVQMLSTPSDNTTRYMSGTCGGVPLTINRTATGGPPSTTETYAAISAANQSAVTVPSWAPFIPDQGWNARDSVQVLWMGTNDVGNAQLAALVSGIMSDCIDFTNQPRRVVVIGVLANSANGTGQGQRTVIDAANAALVTLAATKEVAYVSPLPPSATEMTAIGYTPTTQDNTDIANGIWPTGLRADATHLIGAGYHIMANRIAAAISGNGW